MNIAQKFPRVAAALDELVTLRNARLWAGESEQWLFCTDLLDEAELPRNEHSVDYLERSFVKLLEIEEGDGA